MKILHVIPTYIPANLASGPIQPIHSLNKELVSQGVDVTVYTSNFDGEKALDVPIFKEVLIDGVKVFYFPLTFRPWYYSVGLHRALKKNIKNFNLVHISSVFLSLLTLSAHYAKKFNVPYVVTCHGILMKKPLASKWFKKRLYLLLFDRKNLANASMIHFTTLSEKEEYLEAFPAPKKAVVIPHGISLEDAGSDPSPYFRNKFNISRDKRIIFFLGRINWIKGFDTLLPAVALVFAEEKDTILVIAGPEGGYKKEIDSLISELHIEERILFTGMLEGKEKVTAFRESNVFVLSSYSENFSVVTLEAMSFGLPVVITKGVGIFSLVDKYGAGIVVEKRIKEMSVAVLEILRNPSLASTMGKNGKKLVEAEFRPQQVALKMIKEYEEIINKPHLFS